MRRAFTLLSLLALVAGCSSPSDTTSELVIRPLAIGNKWIGRTTEYDSSGTVVKSWIDTLIVSGALTINAEKWYTLEDHVQGDTASPTLLPVSTNRSDGCYGALLTNTGSTFVAPPFRLARYPSHVGDSGDTRLLTTESDPSPIGIMIMRTTAVDTVATCTAGTFANCYRYDWFIAYDSTGRKEVRSGSYTIWAPGVGELYSIDADLSSRIRHRYELLQYQVK